MLFTWSTQNLCIVSSSWQITGPFSLLVSLLLIVALAAGYEGVKAYTRHVERSYKPKNVSKVSSAHDPQLHQEQHQQPSSADRTSAPLFASPDIDEEAPLRGTMSPRSVFTTQQPAILAKHRRQARLVLGALYAAQVFYSFFIMLLFMTYNGWIMLSVAVGAFVGFVLFGHEESVAKAAACH